MDLEELRDGRDLGGVEGQETVVGMDCMRKEHLKIVKKKMLQFLFVLIMYNHGSVEIQ